MQTNYIFNKKSISDRELVDRIKRGDSNAFTILFDNNAEKLKRSLIAKNSFIRVDKADDYVTDAFVDFYDKIKNGRYEETGSLFNYLYTIAHRLYLKEIGRNKEDVTADDKLNRLAGRIFDNEASREEILQTVEQLLPSLTIGKNEKELSCVDLLYAQYGITKTSDDDYYSEHPGKFTNVRDVRRKRYKCLEKLKENVM